MHDSDTTRWPYGTAVIAALALTALANVHTAPSPAHAAPTRPVSITITEFTFTPPVLTVPVGTTVTWVNRDEEPHTVTSTTGGFGSAGLANEETFAQQFTHPGTYTYFCALHPHMRATVVVK